jgi:hypothetical protein
MSSLQPVYTGTLCGIPVRFFAPQSTDDMMPWIASDDLARALGLPRQHRRALEKCVDTNRSIARTVATDSGPTMILGFQAVQGLMGGLRATGFTYRAELHFEYVRQVTAAARILFPHLFDDTGDGSFNVKSTSLARLLGEDHEDIVARIEDMPDELKASRFDGETRH